ncbi:MAG: hypothetical protein QXK12_07630 [Candidatus Nezhaarchaeales archaeon]
MIKLIGWGRLLTFTGSLLLGLLLTATLFTCLFSLYGALQLTLRGGAEPLVVLAQKGARTIYTGFVPMSLALSLNRVDGVSAEPVILTPALVNGRVVVMRCTLNLDEYKEGIVSGSFNAGGVWLLAGEKAALRLGLRVGDLALVGSSLGESVLILPVVAIYRLGDYRDYEVVAPFKLGWALSGKPEGFVSFIKVKGLTEGEVNALLNRSYSLKIEYEAPYPLKLLILDASNAVAASLSVEGRGVATLKLPFNYYTVIYSSRSFVSTVKSLLLVKDSTIKLIGEPKQVSLKVLAEETDEPLLFAGDRALRGERVNGAWLFRVEQGVYELMFKGRNFTVPLLGDVVFDPKLKVEEEFTVSVEVTSWGSEGVRDFNLLVKGFDGRMYASLWSQTSTVSLSLPRGSYVVEAYKPPYSARSTVEVPSDKLVRLELPALDSRLTRSQLEYVKLVKAFPSSEEYALSFSAFLGLTSTVLLAAMTVMALLSTLSVLTVQLHLIHSITREVGVLVFLGAGLKHFVKMVGLQVLLISTAMAFAAAYLAAYVLLPQLSESLTFMGYSLQVDTALTLAYAVVVAVASWLLSLLKVRDLIGMGGGGS